MATDANPHGDEQTEQTPPTPPAQTSPEPQAEPSTAAPADAMAETTDTAETGAAAENAAESAAEVASPTLAELEAELAREREAAADYLRRWHQAQADLANFRRRAQQEQEQHIRLATGRTLALMLPAIDSFERAFATLPPSLRGFSWISGLALVEMQLQSALAASGAKEVPAEVGAAFNPQHHEAVGEVETAEHPAGHIAAVLQRGYAVEGLLIRPALVQLARAPQAPQAPPGGEGTPTGAQAPEPNAPSDEEGGGETPR